MLYETGPSMKTLEKDELYQHLHGFLKTKGVELRDGTYAQTIQKSCGLLSEVINTGQEGFARARTGIDKKLDQLRQVIHEKTAPRGAASPPSQPAADPQPAATKTRKQKAKSKKRSKKASGT